MIFFFFLALKMLVFISIEYSCFSSYIELLYSEKNFKNISEWKEIPAYHLLPERWGISWGLSLALKYALFYIGTAHLGYSGIQRLVKGEQSEFLFFAAAQALNVWRYLICVINTILKFLTQTQISSRDKLEKIRRLNIKTFICVSVIISIIFSSLEK